MANGRKSNADIYDRIDGLRLEVKQDIQTAVTALATSQGRLEKKFDDLEAGRLTRAEGNISDLRIDMLKTADSLKTNQAVLGTKIIIIWAMGSTILSIIGGIIARKLIQ